MEVIRKTGALSLAFIYLLLLLSFATFTAAGFRTCAIASERRLLGNEGQATWCIAKPSTYNDQLARNIQYGCSQPGVDCRLIQLGGSCFRPDSIFSHASVVMNLYYKAAGKHTWQCNFNNSGLIVTQNPSSGTCNYPV